MFRFLEKIRNEKKIVGSIIFFFGYLFLSLFNNFFTHIPFFFVRHFVIRNIYGLKLGKSSIHKGCRFFSPWLIEVGNQTILHFDCLLDGRGRLIIGDNVDISFGVRIFTESHDLDSDNYDAKKGTVVIENHVVIGAYSTILPGVRIGKGAVVAAGSVVSKDVPSSSVVGGVPAKFIRKRNSSLSYQLNFRRPFH